MRLPDMSPPVAEFWARCKAFAGEEADARLIEIFAFGDSAELADELGALVLAGAKRATASSAWTFEQQGRAPPRAGDLSIVLDGRGCALCVIRTTGVEQRRFDDVDAAFAADEGEGDASLDFWRRVHSAFFSRECARLGRAFSGDMPVLCERFEVVLRNVETEGAEDACPSTPG
jgi:uncharacterized protein YhfF